MGPFAPGARLPVAVSISHAGGHALGAAAWIGPEGPAQALGIDLGLVEPRSPAFLETFLRDEELDFVRDGPAPERDLRANLVWCAKEAVLKVLGVGLTVDTYRLSCLPDPRADAGSEPRTIGGAWAGFVAACDPALVRGGEPIRGLWRTLPGGFVGALAWRGKRERS